MEAAATTEVKTTEEEQKVVKIAKDVPKEELNKVLRYHVWAAMGVSLIPVPVVDLVALTGVQLNMLRVIAKKYEVPFMKDTARSVVSALVGSATPIAVGPIITASVVKFIPILGQTAGVVTLPILGGAATYAVGKVFVQHFASGGTFLTFNPEKVKAYYAEMFKEGEKVAGDLQKEKGKKS